MENPFKKTKENSEDKKIEIKIEDVAEEETENNQDEQSDTVAEVKKNLADSNVSSAEEDSQNEEANNEEPKDSWQAKYEALNNQYVRLAADFDNFRKRQESERENLLKYGAENTVKKLLEVIDNFDRGLKAIETIDDIEKMKECYNLAYKNFSDVMEKIGVSVIKAEGEEFDPNMHEAVMQTPTSDKPEHTIIAELQKGYKLGDKVLRPTLVNVAVSE